MAPTDKLAALPDEYTRILEGNDPDELYEQCAHVFHCGGGSVCRLCILQLENEELQRKGMFIH